MRKLLLFILCIVLLQESWAQKTITGKVTDEKSGQPLEGANVLAKSMRGVSCNANGEFSITLGNDVKTIVISFVGYQTQEIALGSTTYFAVALKRAESLGEIIVTGSRNLSRTRIETPVPVDVIPVSQMVNQVGQVDVNQLLNYVAPSFQSARQTIADGTDHIDPAQLRGLGTDQILVLINGKRRHQSALVNVNGTVNRGQVGTDLSAIPATAIERIEVLRDGAAAQYGSDAIAGVINIVLKKSVGLTGNISYGQNVTAYAKDYALYKLTNRGNAPEKKISDGGTFQVGLNYGFKMKGKSYINLNGEYLARDITNRTGTYTGQVYPNVNGQNRDDSILAARGTNRNDFDMRVGQSSIKGGNIYLNSMFTLNDTWNLQVFGGYGNKRGEAAGFFRYPTSINSGAALLGANALAIYPEGFLPLIQTNISDFAISAGLNGKLGAWDASLSETFGKNVFDYTVNNSINYTQLAVTPNPQTKFDAGGIRFAQSTTNADISRKLQTVAQGLNLAFGAEYRVDSYEQVAGEQASYTNYSTSSNAAAGSQVFAGFTPRFAGKHNRNAFALYTDNELDITQAWMVGAAIRFENYSDFGSTLNYKIATRYKVGKALSIRAAHSTGFRAPSMQQRFYAKTNTLFVSTPTGLQPTESGTFPNGSKPAQILGIPNLKEETSQNFSAGLTLTPIRGLEITVDGYIIDIDNRIVLTNNFTGGTDATLKELLANEGATTANFFTNAIDTKNKGIEAVANYSFKLAKKHNFRITAAGTFVKNEVRKGADGKPIIYASSQLINSGQLSNYFNREDQSRIEVANPRSKANLMINYKVAKFSAMLRFAHFGKVTYLDPTINPANPGAFPVNAFTGSKETLDQEFSGKTVTDLSLAYQLSKNFTFTVGANNLFDIYQDLQNHSSNMSSGRFMYSRRVQQMGFNGRYFFGRLAFDLSK